MTPRPPTFATVSLLLILSVAVHAEVGRPSDTKKALKYCQQAGEMLKSGRLDEGRSLFRKALELAPSLPDAHVGLGQIAMAERKYEDALAEFRLAEAGYQEFVLEVIKRAQNNENAKNDEMMKLADAAGQLQVSGSKAGAVPMAQAQLYNEAERLATGGGAYPSSQELRQPMGQIYFFTGNALFRMGQTRAATEYFKASIELSPKSLPTYTNLAVVQWKDGRVEDALETLSKAEAQGLPVDPKLKADIAATPVTPRPSFDADAFDRAKASAVSLTRDMTPPERIVKVDPVYPEDARVGRIQGRVVLEAIIDENGNVPAARVVSGDPVLARAAVEAVTRWKYKPAQSDGKPVKITSMVQMDFTLREE